MFENFVNFATCQQQNTNETENFRLLVEDHHRINSLTEVHLCYYFRNNKIILERAFRSRDDFR